MPTITLNKEVFEKLVGKTLPLDELKDRISMLGTDLEGIEGNEIQVEVFPNRPDMLSEQGFARAFSSFIGVKTGLRKYDVKSSGEKIIVENSVKGIRPFTACAIVKNLKFDDEKIREIIQIQEKLHITYGRNRKKAAIGIYPKEKITFPVTYKADVPDKIKFRPLESEHEMTGLQILSGHKAGREFGPLLEGLEKFPYFLDAKNEVLSMPPIINSYNTGRISEETKEVFIECSGFEFDVLKICLNIIVTSLSDMGGQIYSLDLKYGDEKKVTPLLEPAKMKLDLEYINKRLGLKLKEKEAVDLLGKMGFGFDNGNVLIPAYRADILHPVDLVEDIAIAYGYENFVEEIPNVATIGEEDPFEKFARKVREILVGLKLMEAKNYHLSTAEDLNVKMNKDLKLIKLKNALGDYNHLRNRLISSLLKNLAENQHHEYPQNIFEIGKTFNLGNSDTGVVEAENLAIALCHESTDFTEIRQVLDSLMNSLGLTYFIRETSRPSFIEGRVGEILIDDNKVGIIGEIHPQVLDNWKLVVPTVVLELSVEKVFEKIKN
jgi:phenylalanyl-tRNA synthetase beta chain